MYNNKKEKNTKSEILNIIRFVIILLYLKKKKIRIINKIKGYSILGLMAFLPL